MTNNRGQAAAAYDRGTVLPMQEAADQERRPEPARKAVILVLDDEEAMGAFVGATLPEATFRTIWRADVASATAVLDDLVPDLALVDISLENGTGWELLRQLRSRPATEHIPIVMMTGSEDTVDRERSLRMGADRFLLKPVRPETLRRVVHEMLSARDDLWWSLTLRSDQVERLRDIFYDSTTEVPTLAVVVEELRKIIESGDTLQVFCLEIEPLFRLGERDHWDALDFLRREFVRGLRVMVTPLLGNDAVVATSHSGANDFYCFSRDVKPAHLPQLVKELERTARTALKTIQVDPRIADEVTIFAGGATTLPQPVFAPRILYNAVREAKDSAERRETRYYHALRERLVRAVRERAITTVFQPVLDLGTLEIVGYEALSRGPGGSEIENPEVIFELARDFDLVWELEALCIANIAPMLRDVCTRGLLFFNLESHFIQQLQHRGMEVFEAFLECHHQVVIEVTERSAIRDYRTFRRTLHDLKAMGFKIAIDDCGSGYATLEAVAELQPDYLKVGHSLFHGVEKDPIRRRLVDLVARCADTIGAKTIAEAIETDEQLNVTRQLGVQYGQGFLFSPAAPWEVIRNWSPVR
jgi:EAL domain-containing protein (putative c-di-GMP-specific phosphodiesterase class I)/DNA-binding response OmpR family regulator